MEKHGRDRYPTPSAQLLKIVEEVGELTKAHFKMCKDDWKPSDFANLKAEMADVALALYNFADKFAVDLDHEIESKVEQDTRKF